MRRFVVFAAVLFTAALAWSMPAAADSERTTAKPCVTRAEYRQVQNGLTKAQVHNIFDFNGSLVQAGPPEIRQYRVCKRWNGTRGAHVRVHYVDGKVIFKEKSF